LLQVHTGASWLPTETSYSAYLLTSNGAKGFEMEYWAKSPEVRETLGRYYSGQVEI